MKWLYREGYVSDKTPPSNAYGFVYEITLDDGRKYIGKKQIWGFTKKMFTQKEVAEMPNKRLKKWKMIVKESKWRNYLGSSKYFGSKDVKSKRILKICSGKKELTYFENYFMYTNDVLANPEYVNDNMQGKFFSSEDYIIKWKEEKYGTDRREIPTE